MPRSDSMTVDADGENKSSDERKGIEDEVVGEKQSLSQVPGMKVNATNEDENVGGVTHGLQGRGILQVHQQQQQQMVVHWERFLHVRSIRVLLVENDDSTRHVVTALLRNCNYEVLEAGNGLQAWKILEDLSNHIDLVLTEVVMPFLSGIALLCKIMGHDTRKNIPVIMMSPHDSMGLVFQCLSKGAVDFLVKPIRKNELKNLWQHIWRRCQSSSGSGSESGTQTLKSVKSKGSQQSDNSGSDDDDDDDDRSDDLNDCDGSDDGSGAQSSWTKQAVQVNSSQAMSPMDQVAECPESTCAQVIRSNPDASGSKRVDIMVAREDNVAQGKELETVIPITVQSKSANLMEIPLTPMGVKRKSLSDNLHCSTIFRHLDNGQLNPTGEHPLRKHRRGINEMSGTLIDRRLSGSTRDVTNVLNINQDAFYDPEEPNLNINLKRNREVRDTGKSVPDDRYVFQRSEQSAFSRYNASSNVFKAPNQITGSRSVVDHSVKVAKRNSVGDIQGHSTGHVECQNSYGNDTNIEMASIGPPADPSIVKDRFEARSMHNGLHSSSFTPENDLKQYKQLIQLNDKLTAELNQMRNSQQDCQIQHDNHHQSPILFHYLEQQSSSNHDESSLKKEALADAPLYGSTNITDGTMHINHPQTNSLNKSISGSNQGSNGPNVGNNIMNAIGTNVEGDVGQARKSDSGDASGSGTRIDENKIARRVAALNKFRQKRKERCFTKKVRYHNRKKLAEQRPRVRGQFVKQIGGDSSNKRTDE